MLAALGSLGLGGAMVAERYLTTLLADNPLFGTTTVGLPRLYGAVVLVNVVGSSIVLTVLGFKVGKARSTFKDKALKDGAEDAEARFSYPKLYAEGFSKHAQDFNCVQRAHQHALETYTGFVACSLIGGLRFPIFASVGGLLWVFARLKWAEGYSTGVPGARYSHSKLGFHIWTAVFIELFAAAGTAVMLTLGH